MQSLCQADRGPLLRGQVQGRGRLEGADWIDARSGAAKPFSAAGDVARLPSSKQRNASLSRCLNLGQVLSFGTAGPLRFQQVAGVRWLAARGGRMWR
jgi:hypothetical protein